MTFDPSAAVLSSMSTAVTCVAVLLGVAWFVWCCLPRVRSAKPNEWLIIINNGEQRLAGVGLKAYVYPMETCVSFPSVLTKVSFEAMQTTKEMQGVKVTGFAVFSVLRTDDGPFRHYKYIVGAGPGVAEDNLKGMAESLMRKHVATTPLTDVLRDRDALRESVHKEMMATTKGWGVWLETFEIQDIQICSKMLFEDLQAEFRQDTHLKAERLRLDSEKTLAGHRSTHEEEMALLRSKTTVAKAKAATDEQTAKEQYEAEARLSRAKAKAVLEEQQLVVEKQKIETRRALEMASQALEHELALNTAELSRARDQAEHSHKLEQRKATLLVDGEMNDRAMQKYQIDSTAEVYKKLPLRDMRISNFVAPEAVSSGGVAALLPAMGALAQNSDFLKVDQ